MIRSFILGVGHSNVNSKSDDVEALVDALSFVRNATFKVVRREIVEVRVGRRKIRPRDVLGYRIFMWNGDNVYTRIIIKDLAEGGWSELVEHGRRIGVEFGPDEECIAVAVDRYGKRILLFIFSKIGLDRCLSRASGWPGAARGARS